MYERGCKYETFSPSVVFGNLLYHTASHSHTRWRRKIEAGASYLLKPQQLQKSFLSLRITEDIPETHVIR